MKKALLSIATFGIILFFGMAEANAQTPQNIVKKGLASTVILVMDNEGYGSGFFVQPEQIATAYHVVEGASSGYVRSVHQSEQYPIVGITAVDRDNDLVILKVSGAHGTPLPIGDSSTVQIQDKVYAVGNPLEYEGTVTDGKIINLLGNRLLTDAAINRGNSGGALLNSKGEVIGIAIEKKLDIVQRPNTEDGVNIGQGLNVAVPSKYLTPLVEKAKGNQGNLKPLSVAGVTGTHLTWASSGLTYQFTLHNQRNDSIMNLRCLVIFKDDGGVICVDLFEFGFTVHPGRVERIERGVVNDLSRDVHEIGEALSHVGSQVQQLMKSSEIRILDFDIAPPWMTSELVPLEGVTGNGLTWLELEKDEFSWIDWGEFTGHKEDLLGWKFSYYLKNHLSEDVKNVVSYVVFYDQEEKGAPIAESSEKHQKIPARGTVQVEGRIYSHNVKQLTKRVGYRIYQEKSDK